VASSIAAASGQVWVIDEKGGLAHFDGSRWNTQKIEFPGPKGSGDEDGSPQLSVTDDGSLWLVWNGVWRWDGSRWTAVKSGGEQFQDVGLVAATGNGLWLSHAGNLEFLSSAGALKKLPRPAMGFMPYEGINDVAETGAILHLGTSRGILEFNGSALAPARATSQRCAVGGRHPSRRLGRPVCDR
jgi:hypothetical protein